MKFERKLSEGKESRTKNVGGEEREKEEVKYEFCHRYGVCHKCSG